MSILSEVPVVLQYVRDHTEAYYQVQRDKTAERITTGSTPQQIDKPLEYSASLDRAEKAWRMRQIAMESDDESDEDVGKKEEEKDAKDEKKKSDADEKIDISEWFTKQTVVGGGGAWGRGEANPPPRRGGGWVGAGVGGGMVGSGSGIKGEEEEVVSLLTQQLATERENNERMLDLTIFIPAGLPLKIRVNEDAIVRDVFTEVRKQKRVLLCQPIEKAYHFYTAENDGKADTSIPVNLESYIRNLGKIFALVENPAFDTEKSRERKGTEMARTSRPLISIQLPNELKTLVPFQADLKISQLLIKICYKRDLDASRHYFTLPNSQTPIDEKMTLEMLNSKEMYLRVRKDSESEDVSMGGDELVFTVSRTNKLQKEVCVLVISTKGLALEKKRRGGKHPRPPKNGWADVSKVTLEKGKAVNIEYSDGRTAHLEADSENAAREIVKAYTRFKD